MKIGIVAASTALLITATTQPAAARDNGLVVQVAPPTGGDDTAILQAALDRCVGHQDSCKVHLSPGRYRTRQLVAYDFRGTFEGAGQDRTVIEPVGTLRVCPTLCSKNPDTTTNLWPDLMIFVDGNVRLSDISIQIKKVPATTDYFLGNALISAVRMMTSEFGTMTATVERVSIEGAHDESSFFRGFGLLNGIIAAGELLKPGADPNGDYDIKRDTFPLKGSFRFSSNTFKTCFSAIDMNRLFDGRLVVGGDDGAGNSASDTRRAFELANFENSTVEISHNRASSHWDLIVDNFYYPAERASRYSIHHNIFSGETEFGDGIILWDNDLPPKTIDATVVHNTVADGPFYFAMIETLNTEGTLIAANRVRGSALAGIMIENGTRNAILGNDVSGVTADIGRILLDSTTTRSLVAGACRPGDVVDQGQANIVLCKARD